MSNENSKRSLDETFDSDRIETILAEQLPKWYYENGRICRKYRSSGWKATLMIVNAIGHLAEAAWHHPDITASYAQVTVELMNHEANGITNKDFELADKIEQFVSWQPALEEGSLEGTPKDPKHRYINYD